MKLPFISEGIFEPPKSLFFFLDKHKSLVEICESSYI